jgi:hypothetical protein
MENPKTKSFKNIENRMQDLDENSLRYQVLAAAKSFKTSWVSLGRALYTVWRDKFYKEWGYGSIETYSAKEIGIKKLTTMKLLRSYYFLEKEEPNYISEQYQQNANAATMPTYESIDMLRKIKDNKNLDSQDYANFKKEIFEKGKDTQQVRRDLTTLIRQRKEISPEEEQQKAKIVTVRRFLSTLKSIKREIEISKLLPPTLLKETESLIKKLETEIHE